MLCRWDLGADDAFYVFCFFLSLAHIFFFSPLTCCFPNHSSEVRHGTTPQGIYVYRIIFLHNYAYYLKIVEYKNRHILWCIWIHKMGNFPLTLATDFFIKAQVCFYVYKFIIRKWLKLEAFFSNYRLDMLIYFVLIIVSIPTISSISKIINGLKAH